MSSNSKKHVAVTGASSGIGEALCREFARQGHRVSMIARRTELLERLARELGADTFVMSHDLANTARACDWIAPAEEALGPIDVLINNAGVQIIGRYVDMSEEQRESLLALNLHTPLKLTQAVLPKMMKRGEGTIVDVASVAALAPTPFMLAYNAAKAGLAAASESLRGEIRGSGVHVVTVYPGPIDTPMATRGYEAYEASFSARATPLGSPIVLARLVRRAVERKRPRVIYPRVYAITRWLPDTTRFFLDRFTPQPRSSLASGSQP